MQAGLSAAAGIKRVYKNASVTVRPLADGGEGTVDALVNGCGGRMTQVQVTGPVGRPVVCQYGIIDETNTAIIEMSGAAGITLVNGEEKNPLNTTTYGVGEVIKDAIQNGCRHFIVGIGGSATNDGGVGMLQALGFGFLDKNGNQISFGAKGCRIWNPSQPSMYFPSLRTAVSALPVMSPILSAVNRAVLQSSDLRRAQMRQWYWNWMKASRT